MSDEFGELSETEPRSKPKKPVNKMTLDKAVEMGEYNPNFLSTFPEWVGLTNNIRWHYIRDAIQNRRKFLLLNWAETNNVLDFSQKPEMKVVLDNIMKQVQLLNQEEEKLRLEYIK
jgi:hypothetical protein